jgi:hypothetical protein
MEAPPPLAMPLCCIADGDAAETACASGLVGIMSGVCVVNGNSVAVSLKLPADDPATADGRDQDRGGAALTDDGQLVREVRGGGLVARLPLALAPLSPILLRVPLAPDAAEGTRNSDAPDCPPAAQWSEPFSSCFVALEH